MDESVKRKLGALLGTDLPLEEFGAKDYSLRERFDFSGHKSGKVAPHLNSEIVDKFGDKIIELQTGKVDKNYIDLTKTQLPGLNEYQYGAKKFSSLLDKDSGINLNNSFNNSGLEIPPVIPPDLNITPNPSPLKDVINPIEFRTDIDTNGYAKGERTSAGFCPNPTDSDAQPGGMLPLNLNTVGNPIKNISTPKLDSPIKGTEFNGFFAPDRDFMDNL